MLAMNEGVADQAAPLDQAILFRGDLAIPIKDLAEKVIRKGGGVPPLLPLTGGFRDLGFDSFLRSSHLAWDGEPGE